MMVLRTYNAQGVFMERITGEEAKLRVLGANCTTVRGQLGWRCDLFCDGLRIATCRRGKWRELPNEAP